MLKGFSALGPTCNPNNQQFYGLYLLIKGYLLLNCRFLEPQVGRQRKEVNIKKTPAAVPRTALGAMLWSFAKRLGFRV